MAGQMANLTKRIEKVESDQTILEESHSQLALDTGHFKKDTSDKIEDSRNIFSP